MCVHTGAVLLVAWLIIATDDTSHAERRECF
jgi:hypothetical protein